MNKLKFLAIICASTFAGAQTVTVGTLTTDQNGATTTITVPVSIAPGTGSTPTPTTPKFSLDVESGNGDGWNVFQTVGNSFTTLKLANVVTDTATAWNPTSNAYVVPTTGMYLIVSSIRLVNSPGAGINYGIGVGTSLGDSPSFTWATTSAALRNSLNSSRLVYLTAGTAINMFAYVDSPKPLGVSEATLSIQQLP